MNLAMKNTSKLKDNLKAVLSDSHTYVAFNVNLNDYFSMLRLSAVLKDESRSCPNLTKLVFRMWSPGGDLGIDSLRSLGNVILSQYFTQK